MRRAPVFQKETDLKTSAEEISLLQDFVKRQKLLKEQGITFKEIVDSVYWTEKFKKQIGDISRARPSKFKLSHASLQES